MEPNSESKPESNSASNSESSSGPRPEEQNTQPTQEGVQSVQENTQPSRENTASESSTTTTETPMKRNALMWGLGAVALVAIGAGVYLYTQGSLPFTGSGEKVVAVVNDREISKERLDESVDRTLALAVSQGVNTDDPAIREQVEAQALTSVVNTVLLIEAAESEGLSVSEDEINTQIAQLEAQYGGRDALLGAMTEVGVGEAELRDDIREQLIVDQYVRSSEELMNISVADAELIEAYQRVSANNEDIPPFAELKETIREQLIAQKQQQATGAIVERLREEADIEIKI